MKSIYFALAFLLLATMGMNCKPKEAAGQSPEITKEAAGQSPEITKEVAACAPINKGTATHKDMLFELTAKLEGDCLCLEYCYSGGCKEHDIQLYWSGQWAESMPPQTQLHVSHHANGDACKAIESGKKCFDLKPLRYQGVEQVAINVIAEGAKTMHVDYTYSSK